MINVSENDAHAKLCAKAADTIAIPGSHAVYIIRSPTVSLSVLYECSAISFHSPHPSGYDINGVVARLKRCESV